MASQLGQKQTKSLVLVTALIHKNITIYMYLLMKNNCNWSIYIHTMSCDCKSETQTGHTGSTRPVYIYIYKYI